MTKLDKSIISKMGLDKLELGKHLRKLRTLRGETLHQVSKGTDIDSPLLSKIERSERFPTSEQIERLSEYYKISEEKLKIKHVAEKILKDYGANDITFNAVKLVNEKLINYNKKNKK